MYIPKKIDSIIHAFDVVDVVNKANDELVQHCHLITELQAINADLLNRIKLLEEKNLKGSL